MFRDFRDAPITLVEIGVFNGASLRTWRSYFHRARIVGVDIDPQCLKQATDGIEVVIGSQADAAFLAELAKWTRPSIIIDDGSHRADHIGFTFDHLFPILVEGGCYIVEDLAAHLGPDAAFWRGDADRPPTESFAEMFSAVVARTRDIGIERVEAFPSAVALWKRRQRDEVAIEKNVRQVLDTNKGTADTWFYYSGFLLDRQRFEEAETAILRATEMGGQTPRFQRMHENIRRGFSGLKG